MDYRDQVALRATAQMIAYIDDAVRSVEGAKATIGQMSLEPGSANVIPSQVTFNLDLRASDDDALHDLLDAASDQFAVIAADAGVGYGIDTYWTMPQVIFDERIRTTIKHTADELGISTMTITGEIGHDSLHLGQVGRSAMMFVRTSEGLSHAEDEHVPWAAVLDAAAVYANTVLQLVK